MNQTTSRPGLASHQVEEGELGHPRPWLSFKCFESLPDREWAPRSGRLGLQRRALRRSNAELHGHRGDYLAVVSHLTANIMDRECEHGQRPRTDRR